MEGCAWGGRCSAGTTLQQPERRCKAVSFDDSGARDRRNRAIHFRLLGRWASWVIARTSCVPLGAAGCFHRRFRGGGVIAFAPKLRRIASCHGPAQRKGTNRNLIIFQRFLVLGAVRAKGASSAVDLVALATYRSDHCERGHSRVASLPEQFVAKQFACQGGCGIRPQFRDGWAAKTMYV